MTTSKDLPLLIARVLLGALFIVAGLGKLASVDGFAGYMASGGVPAFLAWPVIHTKVLVRRVDVFPEQPFGQHAAPRYRRLDHPRLAERFEDASLLPVTENRGNQGLCGCFFRIQPSLLLTIPPPSWYYQPAKNQPLAG